MKKVALPKKSTPKVKAAPVVDWQLVGPCPQCVSPVFYAFSPGNQQVHVWRTCDHNKPPQFAGSGGTEPPGPVSAPEVPNG